MRAPTRLMAQISDIVFQEFSIVLITTNVWIRLRRLAKALMKKETASELNMMELIERQDRRLFVR
jgi:hypothetical protein